MDTTKPPTIATVYLTDKGPRIELHTEACSYDQQAISVACLAETIARANGVALGEVLHRAAAFIEANPQIFERRTDGGLIIPS